MFLSSSDLSHQNSTANSESSDSMFDQFIMKSFEHFTGWHVYQLITDGIYEWLANEAVTSYNADGASYMHTITFS